MNIIIRGYRYNTTGRYWRAPASTMSARNMTSGNGNGSQTVSCIPGSPSFAPQKAQKQSLAGPDLLPKTNFALNTPGSMGEAPSIGRYRVDYRLMHVVVYRRWRARGWKLSRHPGRPCSLVGSCMLCVCSLQNGVRPGSLGTYFT